MKRALAIGAEIFFIFLPVICLLSRGESVLGTVAADNPDGEAVVLQADRTFQQALSKKDVNSTGALLDQEFSWTDALGRTRNRTQFLEGLAAGAANGSEYADLKVRNYGQLAVVRGTRVLEGNSRAFFARIWVKRPAGWLLLVHQDTPIAAGGSPNPPSSAPGAIPPDMANCENPCRKVPFTQETAEQGEVVKAYQAVETAVVSHDAKTWAYHVADEFVGIGRRFEGSPDTKAGRVGQIGVVSNRVILPKMLSLKVYVFGDAAIMIADHQPLGEPPYHVIRVWVNRDGRWQLFHRQETTIVRY